MDEKISTKNVLREQLLKNKLRNDLGKYSNVDQISDIIKEVTGLEFKPIGYAKSFHWVDNDSTDTTESKFGWCMHKYTNMNNDNKPDDLDVQDDTNGATLGARGDINGAPLGARGAPSGDTNGAASASTGCSFADIEDGAKRVQDAPQGDTNGAPLGARGAPLGDIIIYEESISFDDDKIYYSDNYLDLNKKIEEPRYWFWRVIHNRYNNTYTLKRIELGVECTNVKINVPFRIILKVLYNRVKKYEAYLLK